MNNNKHITIINSDKYNVPQHYPIELRWLHCSKKEYARILQLDSDSLPRSVNKVCSHRKLHTSQWLEAPKCTHRPSISTLSSLVLGFSSHTASVNTSQNQSVWSIFIWAYFILHKWATTHPCVQTIRLFAIDLNNPLGSSQHGILAVSKLLLTTAFKS